MWMNGLVDDLFKSLRLEEKLIWSKKDIFFQARTVGFDALPVTMVIDGDISTQMLFFVQNSMK